MNKCKEMLLPQNRVDEEDEDKLPLRWFVKKKGEAKVRRKW